MVQLYRLEKYDKCYELYLDLIKNSEDDFEDERETNLAAVLASMNLNDQNTENITEIGEQIFELFYNKACIDVNCGKYEDALKKLTAAQGKN